MKNKIIILMSLILATSAMGMGGKKKAVVPSPTPNPNNPLSSGTFEEALKASGPTSATYEVHSDQDRGLNISYKVDSSGNKVYIVSSESGKQNVLPGDLFASMNNFYKKQGLNANAIKAKYNAAINKAAIGDNQFEIDQMKKQLKAYVQTCSDGWAKYSNQDKQTCINGKRQMEDAIALKGMDVEKKRALAQYSEDTFQYGDGGNTQCQWQNKNFFSGLGKVDGCNKDGNAVNTTCVGTVSCSFDSSYNSPSGKASAPVSFSFNSKVMCQCDSADKDPNECAASSGGLAEGQNVSTFYSLSKLVGSASPTTGSANGSLPTTMPMN